MHCAPDEGLFSPIAVVGSTTSGKSYQSALQIYDLTKENDHSYCIVDVDKK